jgi:hypothetical protein
MSIAYHFLLKNQRNQKFFQRFYDKKLSCAAIGAAAILISAASPTSFELFQNDPLESFLRKR